jgi:hypothetical protein
LFLMPREDDLGEKGAIQSFIFAFEFLRNTL